jgi:diacylglycerol kinase (ATP)
VKPKGWYANANVAIEGIIHAAKTQRHVRWHFMSALAVILLGLFFGLDRMEFIALSLAIVIVLIAEILNTAIEALVDLVSEEFHPLAKVAKDTAAGAVFVAAMGAVVLGFFLLYPYVSVAFVEGVETVRALGGELAFVSGVAVVISVVLLKAYHGRGRPLIGGMPSGHAALSFSILTSVGFMTENALVFAMTLVMALMVSHSRAALGIHTTREVAAGAFVGFFITYMLFLIFG